MYRWLFGRGADRRAERRRAGRWPQSRAVGCLLWILILIVVLIVLSLLFGGFQKGTKALGVAGAAAVACVIVRE